MVERREGPSTTILNIPLGDLRSSRIPALFDLHERGVDVSPTTITKLRGMVSTGQRTEHRLRASDVLKSNNASKKDRLYLAIAKKGVRHREYQSPPYDYKLNSHFFTENLGTELGMSPDKLRRTIRGMRAEVVYSELERPSRRFEREFRAIAEHFLDMHTTQEAPSRRPPQLIQLTERWNWGSVLEFYKAFYEMTSAATRSSWTPYEIEVFELFYGRRKQVGSTLSELDRRVLTGLRAGENNDSVSSDISAVTGLPIDNNVIDIHRNALIYGRPGR
jgi:hypothetical protein